MNRILFFSSFTLFSKASFSASAFSFFSLLEWRNCSIFAADELLLLFLVGNLAFFFRLWPPSQNSSPDSSDWSWVWEPSSLLLWLVPVTLTRARSIKGESWVYLWTRSHHSIISSWYFHNFLALPVCLLLSSTSFCFISSLDHFCMHCPAGTFYSEMELNSIQIFAKTSFLVVLKFWFLNFEYDDIKRCTCLSSHLWRYYMGLSAVTWPVDKLLFTYMSEIFDAAACWYAKAQISSPTRGISSNSGNKNVTRIMAGNLTLVA